MTTENKKTFLNHCGKYLQQDDCIVMHSTKVEEPNIDIAVFSPTDDMPYWKLFSMGPYDCIAEDNGFGNKFEYAMLVDGEEDLTNIDLRLQYIQYLLGIRLFPFTKGCYLSCGDKIKWEGEDGSEIVGAFLDVPEFMKIPSAIECKLDDDTSVIILQVILLTKEEFEMLLEVGSEEFSKWTYPENKESPRHILCELKRTDKFESF